MATVEKAFRIKNGLIVEGSSATVNGSNVLTEASTEFLQDTTGAMFTNGTYTGITFTYNDSTGVINAEVSTTPTFADRIIFEGTTPDAYELTLLSPEPVADVTVTLPNATDTLVGKATTDTFTNKTFNTGATGNVLQIQGNTISSYAGSGETVILQTNPTITNPYIATGLNLNGATTGITTLVAATSAAGTITLPAATGTVALTSDIPSLTGYVTETGTQTLTNKTISGTSNTLTDIGNNSLTNSSVTVNGTSISLGGSQTITAANPNALTIGSGLSGTSYDGSSAVTVAIDSTVATTSGTQTLTNKTISGTSNTLTDIGNNSLTNSSVTINSNSLSLGGSLTLDTDDISQGSTNKYFSDELAVDAVAQAIANGTQTNITITYDDSANSLSFNASGAVTAVNGTANQITSSTSSGTVTLSLPNAVTFPGTVTLNADPTNPLEAATKQYVDAVAQGLNVHPASRVATTANVDLSNALEAGDTVDGVTLVAGDRVLVKSQSTTSQNGIYVVQASGAAVRAADFNTPTEIVPGDFTFVTSGSTYSNTGWVQTATVTTVGTDPIVFEQFSGAGTYLAGNGLTLTGNSFSIDTAITADLNSGQTFTNKTLTSPTITTPTVSGLYLSDNNIVIEGTDDTHETTLTFTDPTQDNTITFKNATGTVAFTSDIESAVDGFGSAVTGSTGISASYATTSNVLTITNTDTGSAQNIFKNVVVGATTIAADSNDDTLTFTAGSGIGLTAASTSDTITIDNTGVLSIAGTADQITASASTGAVTLSLPQSIATSSSPTFAALTLTGAMIGTAINFANTQIADNVGTASTSGTVIDSWDGSAYRSAKYLVQMRSGNDIETLEVLVNIDGNNNVYITEYADVISNTQLGTTDADYDSGNVRLKVTATTGTVSVKVHRTLIEA